MRGSSMALDDFSTAPSQFSMNFCDTESGRIDAAPSEWPMADEVADGASLVGSPGECASPKGAKVAGII